MAKFNVIVSEEPRERALQETLHRIIERAQPHFARPLEIGHYEPDNDFYIPFDHPYFYIAEPFTTRWLGIFPRKSHRILFYIYPALYGSALGRREINCGVFDRSVLNIIKEEVQRYADAFRATDVNLKQEFASA